MEINLAKLVLVALAVLYLLYIYFFDCRQVNDERSEMVRLKSFRVTQKVNLVFLTAIIFTNCYVKEIDNLLMLYALLGVTMITELLTRFIHGKTL